MTYTKQVEDEKMRRGVRESKRAYFDEGGSTSTKDLEPKSKRERNPYPTCDKSGRMHLGLCLMGKKGYFECGELGHKRRDCLVATRIGRERSRNVLDMSFFLLK